MQYARAVIAAVLATGLVIITFVDETGQLSEVRVEDSTFFDPTFLLLVAAIIILTVPDAIAYLRRKPAGRDETDD